MKKITLMKNLATAAIFALAISSTVSCDPEEKKGEGNEDNTQYTLALANEVYSEIYLEPQTSDEKKIELNTNLTIAQLEINHLEGNEWCDFYLIEEDGKIKAHIIPNDDPDLFVRDLTETFEIKAKIGKVDPISITISRGKYVYIRITSSDNTDFNFTEEDFMSQYTIDPSGENINITIETNAESWQFKDEYDNNWYTVTPPQGTTGTTNVIISFPKNNTNSMQIANMQFYDRMIEEEGYSYPKTSISIQGMQQSALTGSATKVTEVKFTDNLDYNNPIICTNGQTINVPKAPGDYRYGLQITADGNYDVKVYENNIELENSWFIVPEGMSGYHSLEVENNDTGAERSVDVVIFGADTTTELFRFKITQAAE